jgi:succinate dehydrogenase/fumarate reductase flavoprotein subunit
MATDPATSGESDFDETADVVVLGMGAAGSAATIEANDSGAHVVVLEKTGREVAGGNSRVSGGAWFYHEDPDRAATYLRGLCGPLEIPEPVVTTWAAQTAQLTKWVDGLGGNPAPWGEMGPEWPEIEGSDCYQGYRCVDGTLGHQKLITLLHRVLVERGLDLRFATPGQELIADLAGTVTGVRTASGRRIGARGGVVLATGGFEGDPEMLREHLALEPLAVWGSSAATGDGHRMAQKMGAGLWHMRNMTTTSGLIPPGEAHGFYARFRRPGYIWIDGSGRRFVDETIKPQHGQARIGGRYDLHPVHPMHALFDERTRLAGPLTTTLDELPVGWQLLISGYTWSEDNSVEIAAGWIQRADTPAELARLIGVDPAELTATVDDWNAACAAGRDVAVHRPPATLLPLDEPPFYAYRAGPMLSWTNGGLRRDERCRVLDPYGAVIEGLYAAGTVSSTYSRLKDGGFHIADALAFGRVAGREAARRAQPLTQPG